jgi:hypothetical protein
VNANRIARFWAKVEKTETCWLWRAAGHKSGYGNFYNGTRAEGAHRVAWAIANGPIPEGMSVLHHCDNPPCVNPAHLFLGTAKENGIDCQAKGRTTRGERNAHARLTTPEVRDIRRLVRSGISQRRVAAQFNVHFGTVSDIIRRRRWAHVSDEDREAA